jgi:hypothetical protein
MSYCEIAPGHPFHGPYHDREYGFPTRLHCPVALEHTIFEQSLHHLFHEEGGALGALDDQPLEWNQILAVS